MSFPSKPLFTLPDDPAAKAAVIATIRKHHAPTIAALELAMKVDPDDKSHGLRIYGRQPYVCLGCQIGNGSRRAHALSFGAYPLYQLAAEEIFHKQFVLQCYHPQAYEEEADPGPGGVMGVKSLRSKTLLEVDDSASTALKTWLWLNPKTNFGYARNETAAENALWRLAQKRCPKGLSFLRGMTRAPTEPQVYPTYVSNDLHILLGVTALRRLVEKHLGPRLVLIDANNLIGADHLQWSHFSEWSL